MDGSDSTTGPTAATATTGSPPVGLDATSGPDPTWLQDAEVVDPPITSLWLARRLRDAGLAWEPREGDRFVLVDRDMDDRIFLVAPMVVEVKVLTDSRLLAFNGTTEWALDSLVASEALWLPTETDLRLALGERFLALRRAEDRWAVDVRAGSRVTTFDHPDAVGALGLALLAVLGTG